MNSSDNKTKIFKKLEKISSNEKKHKKKINDKEITTAATAATATTAAATATAADTTTAVATTNATGVTNHKNIF